MSAFSRFSGVGLCVLRGGWAYAGVLQRECFVDAPLTLRYALFLHFIPVMGCSINKSKSACFLLLGGSRIFSLLDLMRKVGFSLAFRTEDA